MNTCVCVRVCVCVCVVSVSVCECVPRQCERACARVSAGDYECGVFVLQCASVSLCFA